MVKGIVTNGLALEVVFYPKVGANVYALRTEFIVALMEAARVLRLTFIPKDLATPFPEDFARAASATGSTAGAAQTDPPPAVDVMKDDRIAAALAALMPSPELTAKAGYDV